MTTNPVLEEVARIIEPNSYRLFDEEVASGDPVPSYKSLVAPALDKAERILALLAARGGEAVAWRTRGMDAANRWMPWEMISERSADRWKTDVSYRIGRREVEPLYAHTPAQSGGEKACNCRLPPDECHPDCPHGSSPEASSTADAAERQAYRDGIADAALMIEGARNLRTVEPDAEAMAWAKSQVSQTADAARSDGLDDSGSSPRAGGWERTGYEAEILVNGQWEAGATGETLADVARDGAHYLNVYAEEDVILGTPMTVELRMFELGRRAISNSTGDA